MRAKRIHHLPVLDADKLVGIVTQGDLMLIESLPDVNPNAVAPNHLHLGGVQDRRATPRGCAATNCDLRIAEAARRAIPGATFAPTVPRSRQAPHRRAALDAA